VGHEPSQTGRKGKFGVQTRLQNQGLDKVWNAAASQNREFRIGVKRGGSPVKASGRAAGLRRKFKTESLIDAMKKTVKNGGDLRQGRKEREFKKKRRSLV